MLASFNGYPEGRTPSSMRLYGVKLLRYLGRTYGDVGLSSFTRSFVKQASRNRTMWKICFGFVSTSSKTNAIALVNNPSYRLISTCTLTVSSEKVKELNSDSLLHNGYALTYR